MYETTNYKLKCMERLDDIDISILGSNFSTIDLILKRLEDNTLDREDIVNLVYPIGTIYQTLSDQNPSSILGVGTWVKLSGVVLVGEGNSYPTGTPNSDKYNYLASQVSNGSYSPKLYGATKRILTLNQLPKHKHNTVVTINKENLTHNHELGNSSVTTISAVEYSTTTGENTVSIPSTGWSNYLTSGSGGGIRFMASRITQSVNNHTFNNHVPTTVSEDEIGEDQQIDVRPLMMAVSMWLRVN